MKFDSNSINICSKKFREQILGWYKRFCFAQNNNEPGAQVYNVAFHEKYGII